VAAPHELDEALLLQVEENCRVHVQNLPPHTNTYTTSGSRTEPESTSGTSLATTYREVTPITRDYHTATECNTPYLETEAVFEQVRG